MGDCRTGFTTNTGKDKEAATYVSWREATAFSGWRSSEEARTYRLPTEAEWQYQ
jgi:formylglycine-generating enzyme required for sulfatase activity